MDDLKRNRKEAKMNMKLMMTTMTAMVAGMLMADVSVDNIKCTQRYPWNGLVDIEYTIACDDPNAEIYVNPVGFNGDTGLTVFPTHFTGDGATNTVKAGRHTMVWDAKADMGAFSSKNFQIKMYAGKELSRYIVIDISGGTNATNYAIRHSFEGPNLDDDTCRTSEIWMRLVPPGTFMMGSPTNELGRSNNEDLHKVTITKPFYIGVFEVTQKQWELVKGSMPSAASNDVVYATRPVVRVTYSELSSDNANSFLVLLRKRTERYGFELPTEAQWEYACRAGTLSALNSGENLMGKTGCSNLDKVGRFSANGKSTSEVGSYQPNKIGLYDMHGNVREWCLDGGIGADHLGTDAQVDPRLSRDNDWGNGSSWSTKVTRGGSWKEDASGCRSASRGYFTYQTNSSGYLNSDVLGFRLYCTGNLQQ